MPLYDFTCSDCGTVEKDRVVKSDVTSLTCANCGSEMERAAPLTSHAFGPGRSPESRATHQATTREKLEARARTYDASPVGKDARAEQIQKLQKKGTVT